MDATLQYGTALRYRNHREINPITAAWYKMNREFITEHGFTREEMFRFTRFIITVDPSMGNPLMLLSAFKEIGPEDIRAFLDNN